MSFLVKSPQLPTAATDGTSQVSSYREAETVPLGFGRDKYVSHWVCQPYDWKTRPTKANQPDMQICSIAAEYCAGPMGFVGKIWANGKEQANVDFTFADHGDPESMEFSLPNLGAACRAIVHRGTEDAPASIVANLRAKTAQNHPPMRGKCWIEWIDLDLGAGTTALPDLQVELGRATPAIGGFGVSLFGYHGVNPFAAIYWLLRDQMGFEVEAGFFDDAHWAAQCAALEAIGIAGRTGQLTFCNPTFKNAQDAAALLSTILAHVDGYLYVDDGKFKIGWFPSQAPDMTGMPEITEADLEAVPDAGDWPDWNKGAASVVVVYRDFLRDYNDTPALCPAPANRETGFVSNPARNERPMIHDGDQAALIAAEISTSRASESTITLPVSKSRAVKGDGTPLMPGDLFNWDYGPHALDLVVRVIARRMRSAKTSDLLEIIPERGQFPRPYVAPVDDRVLPTSAAPGIINVADVRLYLLPKGFGALRQIAPLVNRAHRGIYRADLHFSPMGAAPWEDILDSRCFAAKVAVTNGGVTNVAATVRVISTSVDFARMAAQSAVSQVDDSLLLLVDNELMSVGAITTVATNTYDLAILRGRKGTTAAAHADATVGFLFYREEIAAVEHVDFYRVRDGTNTYDAGIATKHFKLQLFTIDEEGLAKPDDPGISLVLPDLSPDDTLGYTITISNEAHTVGCDSAGTVNGGELGAPGTARTKITVERGGGALTPVAAGPNSDQFSIAIGTLANTTATKETNDTVRCDSLTADRGTIAIAITVAGVFTITKIFTLTKVNAGANGLHNAVALIYQRGLSAPTLPSVTTNFTFATGVLTGLNNGWSQAIPAGTDPLYVSAATASSSTPTDNITSGEWATPVIFVENGLPGDDGSDGLNGANVVSLFIYQRAGSSPTLPSATASYDFSTKSLTGLNNGWSATIPGGTDPIWVSTATALSTTSTDTIASGEWATPHILAKNGDDGSPGGTGPTGDTGPGIVYRGDYDASKTYLDTAIRRDVVKYSGSYYLTNNLAKSGTATWGAPTGGDWIAFGASFSSVATELLLAVDATIVKTLVMGDGSSVDAGIIRSNGASAYGSGNGYWLNPHNGAGKSEFRVGDPANSYLAFDGTDIDAHLDGGSSFTIGPAAGKHFRFVLSGGAAELQLYDGASPKGFWAFSGGFPTFDLGSASNAKIQSVHLVATQLLQALSSADPGTTDAPIYTPGGAYIGASLKVQGAGHFNAAIDAAGLATLNGGAQVNGQLDITGSNKLNFANAGGAAYFDEGWGARFNGDSAHHFQLNGCALLLGPQSAFSAVAGRIYDANGVQVVREQFTGGLTTLADVIACLQYHGLST